MHEFKIWGPLAKKIQLKYRDQVCLMNGPDDQGFWSLELLKAECGLDYAFLIDDDPTPYPDPRSEWQPKGVHAASRLYDNSLFKWRDKRWQGPPLSGAVIYEVHIGTFSEEGTFDGAIAHLDHLAELGITHIEVMPIADWAGNRGWGYDGVSLFAVSESYGGPDGFKRFVDACHAKNLAVILDVVYNHFGPVGNYTNKFGPYLTEKHKTPWGAAVNFDEGGSDQVRRFFCDNAEMWLRDYHVDGLRLDAVHEFIDRSAVSFMEQLSAEVDRLGATLGRKLVLIAESDLNDPKVVRPREAGGYGMDAQWSDDFHHALFTLLYRGNAGMGYYDDFGRMELLEKALKRVFVYDGGYSRYRLHSHGRPVEGLSAQHFICFIQNHDQVGNRAQGERLEHLVGMDATKVALGLTLTAPFVPMLFMGEEFAASSPFLYFADHEDAEMAKRVSEGRKHDFASFGFLDEEIPDPEDIRTFERSKLKWSEVHEGRHAEMLEWTRKLIHLRRTTNALNDGDIHHMKVEFDASKRWLTMQRGSVRVLLNIGGEAVQIELKDRESLQLRSREDVTIIGDSIALPPMSLAVVMLESANRSMRSR
jgi:maltooligosyltrehalose trehalohydrolase